LFVYYTSGFRGQILRRILMVIYTAILMGFSICALIFDIARGDGVTGIVAFGLFVPVFGRIFGWW
jgi:hypothetical protein